MVERRADELLARSETVHLAVVDAQGDPIAYPMEKAAGSTAAHVLLITRRGSHKADCLRKSPRCSIEADDGARVLCLRGRMEVVEDVETMRGLLDDSYRARVEVRGIDKYCVLSFRTERISLNWNGETETANLT